MSAAACKTCQFFVPQGGTVAGGNCYRLPPVVTFAIGPSGDREFEQMRPWVSDAEWCGEWRARQ